MMRRYRVQAVQHAKEQDSLTVYIHPSADVSAEATVGEGTRIWQQAQVCAGARIGAACILGKGVYVDRDVTLGDRVKVQNHVSIYRGVTLEDGVFCGPHAVFTNDLYPRAVTPDGRIKSTADWHVSPTLVRMGASIGANATIVCGVTIGRWAMVGAGAVVTRDIPDHGLAVGNPALLVGFVCACGERLVEKARLGPSVDAICLTCGAPVTMPASLWDQSALHESSHG